VVSATRSNRDRAAVTTDPRTTTTRTITTRTLAARIVALAMLIALASVVVSGIAMIGLFRQGATEAARAALARDADTVAVTTADIEQRRTQRAKRIRTLALRQLLDSRQITLGTVDPGDTAATAGLTSPLVLADAETVLRTGSLSTERSTDQGSWLIEGRLSDTTAVLLAQPLDRALADAAPARRRLVIPLVLGLLGGGLAGLVLARQIGRPLGRLTSAARLMSGGDRQVRVSADGPREVVEVAQALNELAAALADSEARQRRFLMNVSHELRTPLTAVTGYAEGLADGAITGPDVPAAAEVIRAEAARLDRRVEDLLALARMEADDFQLQLAPADLTELVRTAALAWRPRAQAAGIGLWVAAPDDPLLVTTDADRLRQALDALADNALRVLSSGESLTFGCGSDGEVAWIEVQDDGPGLAEEELAFAFERGRLTERYRGDRPVGSGLGLALVGELARRLGGRAVARSQAERGISFSVLLPLR
jgi:two-component system, OmpR family, sensor kinase